MTVNFYISPIYCGVLKNSIRLGGRLGKLKYQSDYWWELKIKMSMWSFIVIMETGLK